MSFFWQVIFKDFISHQKFSSLIIPFYKLLLSPFSYWISLCFDFSSCRLVWFFLVQILRFIEYPWPLKFHLIVVHYISLTFEISLDCGSLHILDLWYFTWSWLIANLIKIRSPHLLPVFYWLFYSRRVVLFISLDCGSLNTPVLWYFN